MRPLRSFVRREGRITPSQREALDALLPRYAWPQDGPVPPEQVFGRRAPLTIEIGFGNGDNVLAQAESNPDRDYIGLEVHRPGVGSLLRRAADAELGNLRVATSDAMDFLPQAIPAGCVDVIQLFFPDPWPKKRHHKRRLVGQKFLDTATAALRPGGLLLLATDWDNYAEQMREALDAHPALANTVAGGGEAERADRVLTRFERRAHRLGHTIHDFAYRRV